MWFRSLLNLLVATAASLATMMLFIGILGIVFLSRKARQFADPRYHCAPNLMPSKSFFIRLLLAVGLSAVAVAVSIVLQGPLLFPEHLENLRNPLETTIHRFCPVNDGTNAVVLLKHNSCVSLDAPATTLGIWNFSHGNCSLRKISTDFVTFNAVGARSGRYLFASSNEGRLYAFDRNFQVPVPRILGTHDEKFALDLACTYDGSIIIAASPCCISAWRTDVPGRLWQRHDIFVTSYCFYAQTNRLFCGVVERDGYEIDGLTGQTLRTFPTYCSIPVSIDVSPDGARLAVLNHDNAFFLIDLETQRPLWSKKFPTSAPGARFSPDGKRLITRSENDKPTLLVLSVETGQQLTELAGARAQIVGIAWTENDVVFAWDTSGTISTWNASSGSILRQCNTECLPTNPTSS